MGALSAEAVKFDYMGAGKQDLEIIDWGLLDYEEAFRRQKMFHEERMDDRSPDRLIFVEHPSVITIGKSGSCSDLLVPEKLLHQRAVKVCQVNRGGMTTVHGPGQLVVYPIVKIRGGDVQQFVRDLLEVIAAVLQSYGLQPSLGDEPGIWVGQAKIASIGLAVKRGISYHGVALNVNTDLSLFGMIVPCGHPDARMTSMTYELNRAVDMREVKERVVEHFIRIFGYSSATEPGTISKLPPWLKLRFPSQQVIDEMEELLNRNALHTVCQSARCPNLPECFQRGTATFMILGDRCTRNCRFCAIETGNPLPVDPEEPVHIAQTVQKLGIRHAVITSVTRDDLPDGGADQFVRTVEALRGINPQVSVEVLIPDFGGLLDPLQKVFDAAPDVLNHNVETVPRLYGAIRPGAHYQRSIEILRYASEQGLHVKSGIMLGLGETDEEIDIVLSDLKRSGCCVLTIGQYLSPSSAHAPVIKYYHPDEFHRWAQRVDELGFIGVAAGPLVRSSYRAEEMFQSLCALKR